ncbi:hypothetical protein [Longispora albida]|uniref:hypothetical protein n=1 Tax=Longispora albida TaxID=203523 RepID=UPI00038294D0|nr:hypothetical protein [Longispora albida]
MRGVPLAFFASALGGQTASRAADGYDGYEFWLGADEHGTGGALVVMREDEPMVPDEPYCLVWGVQEGTTYGGVRTVRVSEGQVEFDLAPGNAAELDVPRRFRIAFSVEYTEIVKNGLKRTLGEDVVQ